MSRSKLEELGWRQGSFACEDTIKLIASNTPTFPHDSSLCLIVASQSCDVASSNEPVVEFSIAKKITALNKNYQYNKHPRILHTYCDTPDKHVYLCLLAHEKISVDKTLLEEHQCSPNTEMFFEDKESRHFVDWLASRYKRSALPTAFDQLLYKSQKKRKKIAKKVNEYLLGIYVQVSPDREIQENEIYNVNLLGIVDKAEDIATAQLELKKYVELMREAGMSVSEPKVVTEDKISVATFKQYKRVNFDSLSYEIDESFPPDL